MRVPLCPYILRGFGGPHPHLWLPYTYWQHTVRTGRSPPVPLVSGGVWWCLVVSPLYCLHLAWCLHFCSRPYRPNPWPESRHTSSPYYSMYVPVLSNASLHHSRPRPYSNPRPDLPFSFSFCTSTLVCRSSPLDPVSVWPPSRRGIRGPPCRSQKAITDLQLEREIPPKSALMTGSHSVVTCDLSPGLTLCSRRRYSTITITIPRFHTIARCASFIITALPPILRHPNVALLLMLSHRPRLPLLAAACPGVFPAPSEPDCATTSPASR